MEPKATVCSIMAGVGMNYRMMPDIFRDNRRLPDKSMDRYCFDTQIGCSRFFTGTYKTYADLDREREAAEAKTPKVIVEIKGNLKWTQEEAFQYLEEKSKVKPKPEPEKSKARPERKERTIDEIYYATMAKAGGELPKPKPAKPPASLPQPFIPSPVTPPGRQPEDNNPYRGETVRQRRQRQADAMRKNWEFSAPQCGGTVSWDNPFIQDIRLVRLVLGATRGDRKMTAEEEADYWHWENIRTSMPRGK